jgi:F-type H+-transporting ATPase subunit gamma
MNSMKALAYIETQKLSGIVPAQRAVTAQLDVAALDLLAHYPEILPAAVPPRHAWIVLGTERGFCGNLNQQLLERLASETADAAPEEDGAVLLVGRKLHTAFEDDQRTRTILVEGAGVTEEAPAVLNRIADELDALRRSHGPAAVSAICFDSEGRLSVRNLLPPFRDVQTQKAAHAQKPLLNLSPHRLLVDLIDQYLFSSIFEILYGSLLTENDRRVKHLGDAVRYLDKQCVDLTHRANALRQEQITEEIEVLLLSAGTTEDGARKSPQRTRGNIGPGSGKRGLSPRPPFPQTQRGGTNHGR